MSEVLEKVVTKAQMSPALGFLLLCFLIVGGALVITVINIAVDDRMRRRAAARNPREPEVTDNSEKSRR